MRAAELLRHVLVRIRAIRLHRNFDDAVGPLVLPVGHPVKADSALRQLDLRRLRGARRRVLRQCRAQAVTGGVERCVDAARRKVALDRKLLAA